MRCWLIMCGVLVLPAGAVSVRADASTAEKEKVEALIKHVEGLTNATFVRNDREYDAKTAARFLRGKWDTNRSGIKTARDFIDKAASVSSTTGKAYRMRFKDGKDVKSRDYLLGVLNKLEKSPEQ